MVVVPHGAFTMGTSTSKSAVAGPARRVVIAKAFAVGRFAVSFAEWDACVDDGGCNGYRPPDEGWGRGNQPVINVNWEDADAFTKWLTRKTGHAYQLLSDTEREYVARAGTQTSYWWGNDIDLDRANYDLPVSARPNEGEAAELAKVRHRAMPVDAFNSNPWGLYNVHGNVWEWTFDCWREPGAVFSKPANWASCGQRVSRGGSWNDFAGEATSATRMGFGASSRNALQGFRVARSLP